MGGGLEGAARYYKLGFSDRSALLDRIELGESGLTHVWITWVR